MKTVSDIVEEATDAITKKGFFTSKKIAIFTAAALLTVGAVLIVKRVRDNAENAELDLEEVEFVEKMEKAIEEGVIVPKKSAVKGG